MNDNKITVNEFELKNELKYQNTPILKYSIKYPQFSSCKFQLFIGKLNRHYYNNAHALALYCENDFYKQAIDYLNETLKKNYLFHKYELQVDYIVTDNQDCALSLYFDKGIYTGGANGTSERNSDNWDLSKARRIQLSELYPADKNYPAIIKTEVKRQISNQIKTEDGNFFDGYQKLVEEYFDYSNFYLTTQTLAVYFQEITIAPHSSGTVVFELPFVKGPVKPVSCIN